MGWTLTVSQRVRRHDPTIDVHEVDGDLVPVPENQIERLPVVETTVWEWRAEYVDPEGTNRWITTGDAATREDAEAAGRTFVAATSYEPAPEPPAFPVEL